MFDCPERSAGAALPGYMDAVEFDIAAGLPAECNSNEASRYKPAPATSTVVRGPVCVERASVILVASHSSPGPQAPRPWAFFHMEHGAEAINANRTLTQVQDGIYEPLQ